MQLTVPHCHLDVAWRCPLGLVLLTSVRHLFQEDQLDSLVRKLELGDAWAQPELVPETRER